MHPVHIAGFMVKKDLLTKVSDMLTAVHAKQKFEKITPHGQGSLIFFFLVFGKK